MCGRACAHMIPCEYACCARMCARQSETEGDSGVCVCWCVCVCVCVGVCVWVAVLLCVPGCVRCPPSPSCLIKTCSWRDCSNYPVPHRHLLDSGPQPACGSKCQPSKPVAIKQYSAKLVLVNRFPPLET